MDNRTVALQKHSEWRGKLDIALKAPIENDEDLAIAYTPGVAEPCLEIRKDEDLAYEYTGKGNLVAVITDGTAVLGLGDIGPSAAMPVMEGKCALFKRFGNVNAIPLCVDTKDVDEIVETVYRISKSFGGSNLEDIGAPRCFEIERKLVEKCDIPIFHDDQHGTAIITCAAILNALKVVGKKRGDLKIVVNGAGAAGIAITELILDLHLGSVILCDSKGIVMEGNPRNNAVKEEIAHRTNPIHQSGTLKDAIHNADVFVGVSQANMVTPEMVRSMDRDPIIFAMANPVPEIMPDVAKEAGAVVVGTGRSDFPNQVNNVVAFPGIFKGALEGRATAITEEMKLATAKAIAGLVPDEELNENNILPEAFDPRVADVVSRAVKELI